MAINYQKRLENIQNRRFDKELNESVLSKSFSSSSIPQNVKYLMESMRKIDSKYNDRTIEAAERVKKHLEDNLKLNFARAYRTQGSVRTFTNIKVHSDFDLLTIIDRYHYLGHGLENKNPYNDSDPNSDIISLRSQSETIMEDIYDEVDKTGAKSIAIFNKSLNRKVDIVFCFWLNTKDFEDSGNEYYRGVYLYNFHEKRKIKDYPFAHISQVNVKGDNTNDGSRKCIRLLKTLKADSDNDIDLSSFHLTTIVHSIENSKVYYTTGNELQLAIETSREIEKLISDSTYRKAVKSPNGTEKPFEKDEVVPELRKLKADLDALILDVSKEAYYSYFSKGQMIYS